MTSHGMTPRGPKCADRKIALRVSEELLASLDNWRARQRPVPNRSRAARLLIERGVSVDIAVAAALKAAVNQLIAEGLLSRDLDRKAYRRLAHLARPTLDSAALDALQRRGRRRP